MSAYLKKGIAVWILGFLTFLAAISALNAVILWATQPGGLDYLFTPLYPLDLLISDLEVRIYLWASVALTFIFLGFTCVAAFRKPPIDPDLLKMLVRLNESLAANRETVREGLEENKEMIGTTRMDILDGIDGGKKASEKLFQTVDANVDSARQEVLRRMRVQEKGTKAIREELLPTMETNLVNATGEMVQTIRKQERTMKKLERVSKVGAATIDAQREEFTDMKARIERIESKLVPSQPRLTSQNKTEEVKGIGPRLGKELVAIGITNVGELVMADPEAVAEKTRASEEMVKNMQATAQLLMVPGVDEDDAEMLREAGVNSIKELAEQDPFQLSREIGIIAKAYVEQGKIPDDERPTLEEVSSWIKRAK